MASADALDPANASKNTLRLENTEKRDTLIAIEKKYQKYWNDNGIFEANAPTVKEDPTTDAEKLRKKYPKFFATMAYPYMNGTLHAGHSFTLSKVEFQTGFARMEGKRALFPLGFHCTGMPIKACADKLVREVEMFGEDFKRVSEEDVEEDAEAVPSGAINDDVTKFAAKKGKAAMKAVKLKYQFQIMKALGIPQEEVHKFADPAHWLEFFPPLCKEHCTNFGLRIDWRRSFITTDANPYYDAFVRWQMNRLKELGKIKFGERYTIYSPKDGQPCMDHDRSDGEGIGPQEYTGIKMKVLEWADEAKATVEGNIPVDANVYLVAATLRPETMYGQTCCFVGPKLQYGLYRISDIEYLVCTERAARNMAFQGVFPNRGQYPSIATLTGQSLIGSLVNAPLSVYTKGVRVLPMETVLATKGTGIVTSVPSDSPDDYATVAELSKKADYYKIKKEWVDLPIVPIIQTPSYGDKTAEFLVKKLKINSPKDTKQLIEAKELAYKEGFYLGTMIIGEFKGMEVQAAKPKVRELLIKSGLAIAYSEPEGTVTSRSGDPCVVALCDQWYLDYGETEWRKATEGHVANTLNTFFPETKHGFEANLAWLNQWACARSYGLGSKLPWDPQFLVESLSDSTIYMAYYTICHLLHSSIDGKVVGPAGVKPEQMIDEVWDYVFCRREISPEIIAKAGIPESTLRSLRREFEYFYPLDCRVSGKDLIQNHLTFFLYIHVALFPPPYWPRAVRANGHLMLNGEKMSKSTGNFLTLDDTVKKFGADASRIALADAGDGIEDANFEESVANAAILRLYTLKEWCEEVIKMGNEGRLREGPKDIFWDRVFENEMNDLVIKTYEQYKQTMFKMALKDGFYEFQAARDSYREACTAANIAMHKELIFRFVEWQALMIAPIAPHWAEYIWLELLKKDISIQYALFPKPIAPVSVPLSGALDYVRTISSKITSAESAQLKKATKGKVLSYDPKKPKKLSIYVALSFPSWQEKYIGLVREHFDTLTLTVDDAKLKPAIAKMGEMKKAMPFVQALKQRLVIAKEDPQTVFDRKLVFDEVKTLGEVLPVLKRVTGCKAVEIVVLEEGGKKGRKVPDEGKGNWEEGEIVEGLSNASEGAVPGNPGFALENVE
ncbi:leucyl-tRNA synthetase [Kalaharituber pfeilii]|nr:leucyl-tRNA synthetase [Kalaharituber pfeilii]